MELLSQSPQETQDIAAKLAAKVLLIKPEGTAAIIALEGDLGAGKTTFVQGFTKALGINEAVKSPTFLLIKKYAAQDKRHLYHIDCYRVNDYHELLSLEIEEILKDPSNIVLIEWAERIAPILPTDRITVNLQHLAHDTRRISITP